MSDPVSSAADDAVAVVDAFVFAHRNGVIPALIGACVMWAVKNGGGDLVRQSLANASKMSVAMEAARKGSAQ